MKHIFILLSGLLIGTLASAQDNTLATANTGGVKVVKDSRLDLLIKKQIYINTLAIRNQPGFRVQVISTNKRNEATDMKAKVMQLYPDFRTYLDYQAPYFKVRVGDFKNRDEAADLRDKLSSSFTGGVFVVPATINVQPEKEAGNEESY
ncbi:SPOR domain-containing protein [Chitinophaga sancti]|uniref:SPOR domain-containing protein n=1 Tax=Chitinophaga sancti TaxID=1004 RepID=A0A1K1PK60_9BACT|nr:SPOR domain-containing protein [Chitinophaga sancti]WQD59478.1 SPOR domain-containing protein [Chitinophaga sancti]WQG88388.1 SPOR domain-containing protein [Chitinophaga sancti]SFW47999.1 Sporulation related domain-containing protein [Chitinophaga sancti]